jgi:hypothetical protein
MKPLSDFDLSNINNPLSLSIDADQAMNIENSTVTWTDLDGISNFLLNSINREGHFKIYPNENGEDVTEARATANQLFLFYVLWWNNDTGISMENFLIDRITLKDKTATVSAEDISGSKAKVIPVETTHSLYYPNGNNSSSNDAYTYIIKSGDIQMRNTYINNTNRTIQSGSWVDIKTR